jgi:dihydrolipoamide dehydrogenase
MALIDIKVPDIGDFKDVAVIELLVKPGDTVKAEQSLLTVESDKASMEIPSSHAGVVKSVAVKVGDVVNEGSVILSLEAEGAAASPSAPTASPKVAPPPQPSPAGGGDDTPLLQDYNSTNYDSPKNPPL